MIKFEKNIQSITIDSYSRNIFFIALFFLLGLILTILYKEPTPEVKDIIIFLIPILATVSVIKKRHLELNKPRNTGRLEVRSIIRKRFVNFGLDEIEKVEVNKGRGSGNAGNNFIILHLNNGKSHKIHSTDAFQSNKEVREIKKAIEAWLED